MQISVKQTFTLQFSTLSPHGSPSNTPTN